jgi:hypothetical protein
MNVAEWYIDITTVRFRKKAVVTCFDVGLARPVMLRLGSKLTEIRIQA